MAASRVTTERTGCTQEKQKTPLITSLLRIHLSADSCRLPASQPQKNSASVFTPDSRGQVLPSKHFCVSKHQHSGAPSELMYCCIFMKFIKMVISLRSLVHLISRRHAATHVSLCVRSSHTPLMNNLLKSGFNISFGWFLH